MMASAKRQEEEKIAQQRSFRIFLGTCAMITIGGVAYGVRRQLRKEKFQFSITEHSSSAILAFKALLYGTALCAGGFGVVAGVTCTVYDIKSTEDFATLMRQKLGPLWKPSAEFKQDENAIKDMDEAQEMDYWSKSLDLGEEGQEHSSADSGPNEPKDIP